MTGLQEARHPNTGGLLQRRLWLAHVFVLLADFWRRLRKNKAALAGLIIIGALILTALFAPYLTSYNPTKNSLPEQLQGPSASHPLGTDNMGRDILARLIYGSRITIQVGVISVSIGLAIGIVLGAVAGYLGGRVDEIIMRSMDVMLAFPSILLAIAIVSILGPGIQNAMVAIGIVAVPTYARLVRGSVLAVRENEFVEAARALGNTQLTVVFRHVLPNVMAPIIVQSTLGIGNAILEAAALGFLGLGAQRPYPEWGLMLADGREFIFAAPHLCTFPGLAIMVTVLGFNLLGDGLRDALDPKLRGFR